MAEDIGAGHAKFLGRWPPPSTSIRCNIDADPALYKETLAAAKNLQWRVLSYSAFAELNLCKRERDLPNGAKVTVIYDHGQNIIKMEIPPKKVEKKKKEEEDYYGYGMLAELDIATKRAYFRCENPMFNFFLDLTSVDATINGMYLISGLYDCFNIGIISYRVGINAIVLKYRVGAFADPPVEVSWTHPAPHVPGDLTADTSSYKKRLFTYERLSIQIYPASYDPLPDVFTIQNYAGVFTVTDSLTGPSEDYYLGPKTAVCWYTGEFEETFEPTTFDFSKLKFHVCGFQKWATNLTGTIEGSDPCHLQIEHGHWFYWEGSLSYWTYIPYPSNMSMEVALLGGDYDRCSRYYYGIEYDPPGKSYAASVNYMTVIWIRDHNFEYVNQYKAEVYLEESCCYPLLATDMKSHRGWLRIFSTHLANHDGDEAYPRTVGERSHTVYQLLDQGEGKPAVIARKMTYKRDHPVNEQYYDLSMTVYGMFWGGDAMTVRNQFGGGIEGRASGMDPWVGYKMLDMGTPGQIASYQLLRGVYVLNDDLGAPQIYGIVQGSSPPVAEEIPISYFPFLSYPFGQVNKIGGGRELLGPEKFNILTYVAVALVKIGNFYPIQNSTTPPLGWGGIEDFDFYMAGRKIRVNTGLPFDMVTWSYLGHPDNFGIWSVRRFAV